MSYTETHFAKFKIVSKTSVDTLKYIEDNKLTDYFDIEIINDVPHYIEVNNDKYDIVKYKGELMLIEYIEHERFNEDESLCNFTKNDDNTYNLTVQFYNGGCCFEELLEEEINDKL